MNAVQQPGGLGVGTCVHDAPVQCSRSLVVAAHALRAELPATSSTLPKFALDCRAQVLPFQCRISVAAPELPAAQALPADVAATLSRAPPPAGACPGSCRHLRPFQCRTSGVALAPVPRWPTAQAFLADVAATLARAPAPGTGLACWRQAVPFQRRIRTLPLPV